MGNGIMKKLFYLMTLVVLLGLTSTASAVFIHWTDGDPCNHLWSDGDNWDEGHPPTSTEGACISAGLCEIDSNMVDANKAVCQSFGDIGSSDAATLDVNGGELDITTSDVYIAVGNPGTLNVTNGGKISCGSVGCFRVGWTANGTLYMNNGTITTAKLKVGENIGSTGQVTIDSGDITVGTSGMCVGPAGHGTLTMNTGAGTVTAAGELTIGGGGNGALNLHGGTLTCSDNHVHIGYGAGIGTVNMTGGTLSATDSSKFLYIGVGSAVATLTMSGGTVSTTGSADAEGRCYIGSNGSGSGTVNVNGGNFSIGGILRLGNDGGGATGTLNIADGNVAANKLFIGANAGSVGDVNMTGGTVNVTHQMSLGTYDAGDGYLLMTGGNLTSGGTLYVGQDAGALPCCVELDGGTINAADLFIKSNSSFDIEAGTLVLAGDDRTTVNGYINDGLLTGYGKSRNVQVYYDGSDTIVTADANLVYYAYSPSPYDGETVLAWDFNDVNLVWAPGDSAAIHRIYFGQTFDEVNDANISTAGIYKGEHNLDANEFDPGTLELDQSYYWRIDEVNDVDEWKGSVWEFTVPAYALIDDFESYADTAALQAVWGSNGALEASSKVDNDQSMAIAYNNTSSPYYTEVTRDYGSDQDWTILDLKLLELYFHGDKGNAADKIYVKLDDGSKSKTIYYDDPNAITEYWRGWQVWRIDLAEFSSGNNVDLSKVRKITIGVSADPPAAGGGSGTVYVDDIRLYPPTCFVDDALTKGGLAGDCAEIDFDDLDELVANWTDSGFNVSAVTPNDVNLLVWYKFDETSGVNAYDSSSNGYTATVNQSSAWDPCGYDGRCLGFDGTVSASMPAATFSSIDKQITISVWTNGDASLPFRHMIFEAKAGTTGVAYVCCPWPENDHTELVGRVVFDVIGEPSNNLLSYHRVPSEQYAGQWNHYAFVKNADSGTQSIYCNGELVAQRGGIDLSLAGIDTALIGDNGTANRFYKGKMDDFRIYNRALSQAEIVSLADRSSVYQPLSTDADINEDNSVDFEDFAILAENWLTQPLLP